MSGNSSVCVRLGIEVLIRGCPRATVVLYIFDHIGGVIDA